MDRTLVTATAQDGSAARAALTATERETCARLELMRGRKDFRAGRLAAKRAAGEAVGGCPLQRIEVGSGPDGSPRLALIDRSGRSRPAPIEISISHRDGRAAAAAAPAGLGVGVDLERRYSVPRRMGRYFLTKAEQALDIRDITRLWSVKEATWKALGLGHSMAFKELELCHATDGVLLGVRVRGAFHPVSARFVHPWPGYHMVTVWTSGCVA